MHFRARTVLLLQMSPRMEIRGVRGTVWGAVWGTVWLSEDEDEDEEDEEGAEAEGEAEAEEEEGEALADTVSRPV